MKLDDAAYWLQMALNAMYVRAPVEALRAFTDTVDEAALMLLLPEYMYSYIPAFSDSAGDTICNGPVEPLVAAVVRARWGRGRPEQAEFWSRDQHLQLVTAMGLMVKRTADVYWHRPDLHAVAKAVMDMIPRDLEELYGAPASRLAEELGRGKFAAMHALGLLEVRGTLIQPTAKLAAIASLAYL